MNGFAPSLIQTLIIRSLHNFYPQNSNPTKSKMAAAAISKITFLAITWPLLQTFAPNLIPTLKTASHSQIYRKNLRSAKIQDGGGRHFWMDLGQNGLVGSSSKIFSGAFLAPSFQYLVPPLTRWRLAVNSAASSSAKRGRNFGETNFPLSTLSRDSITYQVFFKYHKQVSYHFFCCSCCCCCCCFCCCCCSSSSCWGDLFKKLKDILRLDGA